jgi:hypothetical protein
MPHALPAHIQLQQQQEQEQQQQEQQFQLQQEQEQLSSSNCEQTLDMPPPSTFASFSSTTSSLLDSRVLCDLATQTMAHLTSQNQTQTQEQSFELNGNSGGSRNNASSNSAGSSGGSGNDSAVVLVGCLRLLGALAHGSIEAKCALLRIDDNSAHTATGGGVGDSVSSVSSGVSSGSGGRSPVQFLYQEYLFATAAANASGTSTSASTTPLSAAAAGISSSSSSNSNSNRLLLGARCKTFESRTAAYSLLTELCSGSEGVQSLKELLMLLRLNTGPPPAPTEGAATASKGAADVAVDGWLETAGKKGAGANAEWAETTAEQGNAPSAAAASAATLGGEPVLDGAIVVDETEGGDTACWADAALVGTDNTATTTTSAFTAVSTKNIKKNREGGNSSELMEAIGGCLQRPPHHWSYHPSAQLKSPEQHVGLKNQGATCYMNSFLQQLFHVRAFSRGLVLVPPPSPAAAAAAAGTMAVASNNVADGNADNRGKEGAGGEIADPNEVLLAQLQRVFALLAVSEKKYHDPLGFCSAFLDYDGCPVPLGEQKDAYEFATMLFDKLESASPIAKQLLKASFEGKLVYQVKTPDGTQLLSSHEEPYFMLTADVKNKKSLQDSLDLFVAGEPLSGDNKYEFQGERVEAVRTCAIQTLPPTLIVHLKRFDYNLENFTKIKVLRCSIYVYIYIYFPHLVLKVVVAVLV